MQQTESKEKPLFCFATERTMPGEFTFCNAAGRYYADFSNSYPSWLGRISAPPIRCIPEPSIIQRRGTAQLSGCISYLSVTSAVPGLPLKLRMSATLGFRVIFFFRFVPHRFFAVNSNLISTPYVVQLLKKGWRILMLSSTFPHNYNKIYLIRPLVTKYMLPFSF